MFNLKADLAEMAGDTLAAVAQELRRSGLQEQATDLARQGAAIQLMSPALQACWGGPFNGQAGRLAIVKQILDKLAPQAIIETGTFRGITAQWFATHFNHTVWTCEAEEVYFLQAAERTKDLANVRLELADSRDFLRRVIPLLDVERPSFIYLDAHWNIDLPLREELNIIFSVHPNAVVMIDDFRIPDDAGYGWDDYGPRSKIDASILQGILPENASVYVPLVASSDETGAKRGCCVIACSKSAVIDGCSLLKSTDVDHLLEQQGQSSTIDVADSNHGGQDATGTGSSPIEALQRELAAINLDRAKRLQNIETLHDLLASAQDEAKALRAEREDHLREIDSLTRKLAETQQIVNVIDADRAERLRNIEALQDLLVSAQDEAKLLKAEREVHLQGIDKLTEELSESQRVVEAIETDRAQRLRDNKTLTDMIDQHRIGDRTRVDHERRAVEAIETLQAELATVNLDRAERLRNVEALHELLASAQDEAKLLRAERGIHLQGIDRLTKELFETQQTVEAIDADRAQRLRDNKTLTDMVDQHRLGDRTRVNHERRAVEATEALRSELDMVNSDRAERLQHIEKLHELLISAQNEAKTLRTEREIHLRDIDKLTKELVETQRNGKSTRSD